MFCGAVVGSEMIFNFFCQNFVASASEQSHSDKHIESIINSSLDVELSFFLIIFTITSISGEVYYAIWSMSWRATSL